MKALSIPKISQDYICDGCKREFAIILEPNSNLANNSLITEVRCCPFCIYPEINQDVTEEFIGAMPKLIVPSELSEEFQKSLPERIRLAIEKRKQSEQKEE